MWRLGTVIPLTLVAACQFSRPEDIDPVDARELDAVDAPPPCTPSTIVCDDGAGVYTECDATGTVVRQLTCPLGCATDTEQCLDIDPHNGLAMYLDMVENPPDVVLSGEATIDPVTGLVFDDAIGVDIPMFVGALRVYVVGSLRIDGSLRIPPTRTRSYGVAIVSHGDIIIHGTVDVSADGNAAGPGGTYSGDDVDEISGASVSATLPQPSPGASGAGGAHPGGRGGHINMVNGPPGGAVAPFEQFFGGRQGGTVDTADRARIAWGGAGGGVIQLTSRTRIELRQAGQLDASGGGGQADRGLGGGGGGAGGRILLEAPDIILDGQLVVISVKGGAGAGASSTTQTAQPGEDGGTTATPATGGSSPVGNGGGRGGTSLEPGPGVDAVGGGVCGGGGGGSAGRVELYTRLGGINPINGAAVYGPSMTGQLSTRRIP